MTVILSAIELLLQFSHVRQSLRGGYYGRLIFFFLSRQLEWSKYKLLKWSTLSIQYNRQQCVLAAMPNLCCTLCCRALYWLSHLEAHYCNSHNATHFSCLLANTHYELTIWASRSFVNALLLTVPRSWRSQMNLITKYQGYLLFRRI